MVEKSFLVINGKTVGLGGKIPAKNVTYSNVDTDLKSIDVQNAINEVYAKSVKASEKGQANGVATLNLMGVIPSEQLNVTGLDVKGTWDASTNTPFLANGNGESGDFYIVNVAGSANFGAGEIDFAVGDWVLYTANGTWVKSVNASAVQSVNGKTGVVNVLDTDVLNEAQVEAVNSGITKAQAQQIETNKTHISETRTSLDEVSTQVTTNKAEIDAKINEILYHGRYTDIYVDYQNGNDSNDGLSEANPRKTVPDDEFIARLGNNIFVRINLMSNYDGVISLPATNMTAIVIRKAENIEDEIVVNGYIDTVHTNTVIQNLTINSNNRCVGVNVGFCYISNCNLTTTASLCITANQSILTITDCNISATNLLRLTSSIAYISATKSVSLTGNLIAPSSFNAIANISTTYITTTGLTYDTDVIPVFVNGKLRAVESLIDDVSAMNDAILENKNDIENLINDTTSSETSTYSSTKISTELNKRLLTYSKQWYASHDRYVKLGSIPISTGSVSVGSLLVNLFAASPELEEYPVGTINVNISSGASRNAFNINGFSTIVLNTPRANNAYTPRIVVDKTSTDYVLYVDCSYNFLKITCSVLTSTNFAFGDFETASNLEGTEVWSSVTSDDIKYIGNLAKLDDSSTSTSSTWSSSKISSEINPTIDVSKVFSNGSLNIATLCSTYGNGRYVVVGQGTTGNGSATIDIWTLASAAISYVVNVTYSNRTSNTFVGYTYENPTVNFEGGYLTSCNHIAKVCTLA